MRGGVRARVFLIDVYVTTWDEIDICCSGTKNDTVTDGFVKHISISLDIYFLAFVLRYTIRIL